MNPVKAIWTNGRIVPTEPVNWPEGSQLLVEQVNGLTQLGIDESDWQDNPEALADWTQWIKSIEPLDYTEEESASLERFQDQLRRFNIEAVRKQMGLEQDQ